MAGRGKTTSGGAGLGVRVRQKDGRALVEAVFADGPAYHADLSVGDEIIALDGYRVSQETLDERLADRQPGDRVTLTLFRRDELREVTLALGQRPYNQVEITPRPDATAEQRALYEAWLGAAWPEGITTNREQRIGEFAHADLSRYQPVPEVRIQHPEWSKNATIYQINTRQFTPEGTFRAAEAHLPRLKALGVDILWLMPVHPIGEMNRKGSLGSPYAVKDYYGVNPEFGTLDDLKHFVQAAHSLGLHVILDWVANHTAWDNVAGASSIPSGTRATGRGTSARRPGGTGPTSSTWTTACRRCAST